MQARMCRHGIHDSLTILTSLRTFSSRKDAHISNPLAHLAEPNNVSEEISSALYIR